MSGVSPDFGGTPGPGSAVGTEQDPGLTTGAADSFERGGEPPSADAAGAASAANPGRGSAEVTEADLVAESADRSSAQPMPEAESVPGSAPEAEATPGPAEDPFAVATRERDEYKDALIRLQADFENYKKRMLKQQTEHLERAAGQLVEKLLPALDACDLAVAHGAGEDVKAVTSSLFGALEREGLERIDDAGAPFDPNRHDAVAHEPGDGAHQEVAEVMRAGYLWKGRVLRPAMVKVRG